MLPELSEEERLTLFGGDIDNCLRISLKAGENAKKAELINFISYLQFN